MIKNKLPKLLHVLTGMSTFNSEKPEDSPICKEFMDIIGSRIMDIGVLKLDKLKSGDGYFAIDYKKNNKIKRVIFGFNELGIWVDKEKNADN